MSKSQSVVCTFLKLPPQEQTFVRIREITGLFPPQLNYLNLVAVAIEEANPRLMLHGKASLDGVRKAAGLLCGTLSGVISLTQDFATCFLVLVDSLRTDSPTEQILQRMSSVVTRAESNAKELDKAEKEVTKFSKSIESAISDLRSTLKYRSGARPVEDVVPTEEISEVVNEIVHGVHECGTLLRQCIKYYRQTGRQYSDTDALKSDPPSKEEIEMARERWIGFSKTLKGLTKGFSRVRRRLEKPPTARRLDDFSGSRETDETSSLFSDSDSETGTQSGEEGQVRTGHRRMLSGFSRSIFKKGFGGFWSSLKAGIRGKTQS